MKITIKHKEEFDSCILRGINPLFYNRHIKLEIELRLMLQNDLFGKSELGKGNVVRSNDKYYHYCFNNSLLACENCGRSLHVNMNIDSCYTAKFISHILSRGSRADLAHDPRNHNILCVKCHAKWESDKKRDMIIYLDNQIVIKELNDDYNLY